MTGRLWLCAYALGVGGLLLQGSAAAGLMRRSWQNQQAAQAQAQAARSQYDKAYGVCLEGRGYQVR